MVAEIYVGIPGSGKSLHATARLLDHLQNDLICYTNLPLNLDAVNTVLEFDPVECGLLHLVDHDFFFNLSNSGIAGTPDRKVKIIWDEASEQLDSYVSGKKLHSLLSWIRLHRHYHCDIDLITQSLTLIQARVRQFAQHVSVHTAGSQMRLPPFGIRPPPPWRFMLGLTSFDRTGKFQVGRVRWAFLDRRIAACYKTDAQDISKSCTIGKVLKSKKGVRKMSKMQKLALKVVLILTIANIVGLGVLIYAQVTKTEEFAYLQKEEKPLPVDSQESELRNTVVKVEKSPKLLGFVRKNGKWLAWYDNRYVGPGDLTHAGIVLAVNPDRRSVTASDAQGLTIIEPSGSSSSP